MEEVSHAVPATAPADDGRAVGWRDLRSWLDLVKQQGQLQELTKEVDPQEELAAITFMATRGGDAPAFLFENLKGNRSDARILSNMLGASKERYALAVGIDPSLGVAEMIVETRNIMKRRIAPVKIPKSAASVNEIVLRGDEIDLTKLPVPTFWPGDGGQYIGTGDITFTADPATGRINVGVYRQMLHSKNTVGRYF
jgi:4-hydroxy-3-polyprenylbenzoate decarboxylase